MKTLVLAEKPSVGKDIARVLGCKKSGGGFIEGPNYIVTWALGHLVTLADPEYYNKAYKQWQLTDLPILPETFQLVVIKETGKQYQAVKTQLLRKDVGTVVIATDAGREGELVARWIIQKNKLRKPLKRLWISSVTDRAIKEGFSQLKDAKAYDNLFLAAQSRAQADWLVGINATRALTSKYNTQLSCGRVQTPTLAMIDRREDEIRRFVPKQYYGIKAQCGAMQLTWLQNANDTRTFDKEKATTVLSALKGKSGVVSEIKKMPKKRYSKPLYDLTELQRDASNLFGFSPKETLSLMQRLYENHKLLTYPRTDSRYITKELCDSLPERFRAVQTGKYKPFADVLLKTKIKPDPRFADDKKVTDHHAIIPTEQKVNFIHLSDSERKIYDLVVKRFLAVFYPPYEYEETTLTVKIGTETFTAKGSIVKSDGYQAIYSQLNSDDDGEGDLVSQRLPVVHKADTLAVDELCMTQGQTKPPAYFTEATLLSAMENPSNYVNDKDLSLMLKQTGGLGTAATRADIIEKLFNTFLIEKRDRSILVTSKGRQLLSLAPDELKSPALTGKWEQELTLIAQGKLESQKFLQAIRGYTISVTSEIKSCDKKFRHENITGQRCPQCNQFLLSVQGKKGKLLICQDRECGYRKSVSLQTNARCPKCKKKLELIGDAEKKRYVCVCGYTERAESFIKRRKEEGGGVTKRDVNAYMRKQQKQEEPVNTALKDALSQLTFDKD